MISNKHQILAIIAILYSLHCRSQESNESLIGKKFPNYRLTDIRYYSSQQSTINDFKGKWLILDFWGEFCKSCIESFPHLNELQKEFYDSIKIVLVGNIYKNKQSIIKRYEQYKKEMNLNLSIAYDSTLGKEINAVYYPDIIIIDPDGVVRARRISIDQTDIKNLLAGKNLVNSLNYDSIQKKWSEYDKNQPFLTNNNGGNDTSFYFRSLIAAYNPNLKPGTIDENGRFEWFGANLSDLCMFAFWGKTKWNSEETKFNDLNPSIIWETKDSTKYKTSERGSLDPKTRFVYSICYPQQIKHIEFEKNTWLQKALQHAILDYFPLEITIEERPTTYYKLSMKKNYVEKVRKLGLTAKDVKYRSKGRKNTDVTSSFAIIQTLKSAANSPISKTLVVDETNIDFPIKWNFSNVYYYSTFLDILKENGIELILSSKKMKSLVIKDISTE